MLRAPNGSDYRVDSSADYETRAHIRACLDTYCSHDIRGDTYLGYNGCRHQRGS